MNVSLYNLEIPINLSKLDWTNKTIVHNHRITEKDKNTDTSVSKIQVFQKYKSEYQKVKTKFLETLPIFL